MTENNHDLLYRYSLPGWERKMEEYYSLLESNRDPEEQQYRFQIFAENMECGCWSTDDFIRQMGAVYWLDFYGWEGTFTVTCYDPGGTEIDDFRISLTDIRSIPSLLDGYLESHSIENRMELMKNIYDRSSDLSELEERIRWLDKDIRYFRDEMSAFIESDFYSEEIFSYDFYMDEEEMPLCVDSFDLDLAPYEEKVFMDVSSFYGIDVKWGTIFLMLYMSSPDGSHYEIDVLNVSTMQDIIQNLQESCEDGIFETTRDSVPVNYSLKDSSDSSDRFIFDMMESFTNELIRRIYRMS